VEKRGEARLSTWSFDENTTSSTTKSASDCARHLRMLARASFLQVVSEKGQKANEYTRLGTWPPNSAFFGGTPIGVAYYLQKWFRYYLQDWINKRMRELESKEGVYSLDQWYQYQLAHTLPDASAPRIELRIPITTGGFQEHRGGNIASDVSMMQKPVDISEMTLEWVQETNDVIFGDLSKTDRMLLYLMYARSMDMAEARDLPGM
jgi:hypothetical protein